MSSTAVADIQVTEAVNSSTVIAKGLLTTYSEECNEQFYAYAKSEEHSTLFCNAYAAKLMKAIYNDISAEEAQKMFDQDPRKGGLFGGLFAEVAFSQITFALVFGFGIFMAFFLIVIGVLIFFKRCIWQPQQYNSGLGGIVLATAILSVSVILMIVSTVLLLYNTHLLRVETKELLKKLSQDSYSLSAPLQIFAGNTICSLNKNNMKAGIEDKLHISLGTFLKKIDRKFDYINGTEVFNIVSGLKGDALSIRKVAEEADIREITDALTAASNHFLSRIYITDLEANYKMGVFDDELKKLPQYFYNVQRRALKDLDRIIQFCIQVLEELIKCAKSVEEKIKLIIIETLKAFEKEREKAERRKLVIECPNMKNQKFIRIHLKAACINNHQSGGNV